MSEKYKIYPGGLFFVTLTVVGWIDIFTRKDYSEEIIKNLNHCIDNKGLSVYCYCIMPSHIHMIASVPVENGTLGDVLRDFKGFSAKQIMKLIKENNKESRRKWLNYLFKTFAKKSEQQFWQHKNHAISIETKHFRDQKVDYIHNNPVKAGIVTAPEYYYYSSANPTQPLKLSNF
jgi:putative transposase